MVAAPFRHLRLAVPIAGVAAILAVGLATPHRSDLVTATVSSSVKKPRPAMRSLSTIPAKRAKSKPRAARPAAAPRVKPTAPAAPNDPLWSSSWSLERAHAAAAWSLTAGVSDTVVAVLDTGVDVAHPDLQGSFVQGYDVVNRDDDASDDHGHGTLVAGVLGARANNHLGSAGACSGCSIMPVKVIAANGSGSATDIAEGIRWATEHGADVINMSFTLSGPDDGVAQAIALAHERGVLVVAAAGNAGTADLAFPAAYPGVVSVAGSDATDARYDWSNYGGWVRLAAPGCSVGTAAGGGYGEFCGTSSATAFVSGLVGLARSFVPDRPSVEIVDKLASSSAPVAGFVAAGRVDAGALLISLRPDRPQPAPAAASATVHFESE